jgi:hypothetical protein
MGAPHTFWDSLMMVSWTKYAPFTVGTPKLNASKCSLIPRG